MAGFIMSAVGSAMPDAASLAGVKWTPSTARATGTRSKKERMVITLKRLMLSRLPVSAKRGRSVGRWSFLLSILSFFLIVSAGSHQETSKYIKERKEKKKEAKSAHPWS
jgi:hypothetical protein